MSANLRQSLGISDGASVSATFANLALLTPESPYVMALSALLQRFPGHYHLFSGPGSIKTLRARLHADGVLQRVRFMGNMTDPSSLMEACDFYLAPLDTRPFDETVAGGKPAVVMTNAPAPGPDGQQHARSVVEYIEMASRLIQKR